MAELIRSRPGTKRRSMPARVRPSSLLEDSDNQNIPLLLPANISDTDHHILDLMLNESFDELDYNREQSTVAEEGQESPSFQVDKSPESLEKSLLLNPGKEEIDSVLLSQDVIESLTTVKHVALIALDSLLRQIVADDILHTPTHLEMSSSTNTWRRRSTGQEPLQIKRDFDNLPRENTDAWIRSQLLADIAQNATKLGNRCEMLEQDANPVSSPDVATLDEIQNQLKVNSPIVPSDDYSLACTLATLLGYLYRILELSESQERSNTSSSSPSIFAEEVLQNLSTDNIYVTLRNEVTNLQNRHSNLANQTHVSDERLETWNEIYRLMEIVSTLCRDRSIVDPPPQYSTVISENNGLEYLAPPKYSSLDTEKAGNEKTQRDLDNVISAIDRVFYVAPQLTNQRVELSYRQTKQISAAALTTAIQKLSRGRYEEQRAHSPVVKYQTLNHLVDQINNAASRSFVDQRVELNPRQIRHFEVAKLNGVLERMERNRMTDQDWHPPEQLLVRDLTMLTSELIKSSTNSAYASQRFQLSPVKERVMFMNSVFKKVEKMRAHRMDNQDADPPVQRRERAFKEIAEIVERLRPAMEDQRAIWNPKKPSKFA